MVSTTLKDKYPDFSFMGEETYKPGDKLTPNPTVRHPHSPPLRCETEL